jgi:hypothetical protein
MARFSHLLLDRKPRKEDVVKEKNLLKKIAKLETINDQLSSEINYLEKLTRALGFAEGLKTLKSAALDMLESDHKKEKPKTNCDER